MKGPQGKGTAQTGVAEPTGREVRSAPGPMCGLLCGSKSLKSRLEPHRVLLIFGVPFAPEDPRSLFCVLGSLP